MTIDTIHVDVEVRTYRLIKNERGWKFWQPREKRVSFDSISDAVGNVKPEFTFAELEKAFVEEYGPRSTQDELNKFFNFAHRLGVRKVTT